MEVVNIIQYALFVHTFGKTKIKRIVAYHGTEIKKLDTATIVEQGL
jgi:hypothetical protein